MELSVDVSQSDPSETSSDMRVPPPIVPCPVLNKYGEPPSDGEIPADRLDGFETNNQTLRISLTEESTTVHCVASISTVTSTWEVIVIVIDFLTELFLKE